MYLMSQKLRKVYAVLVLSSILSTLIFENDAGLKLSAKESDRDSKHGCKSP